MTVENTSRLLAHAIGAFVKDKNLWSIDRLTLAAGLVGDTLRQNALSLYPTQALAPQTYATLRREIGAHCAQALCPSPAALILQAARSAGLPALGKVNYMAVFNRRESVNMKDLFNCLAPMRDVLAELQPSAQEPHQTAALRRDVVATALIMTMRKTQDRDALPFACAMATYCADQHDPHEFDIRAQLKGFSGGSEPLRDLKALRL